MRSKLTKTIILIVFVIFLGINDVNAKESCSYRKSNHSDMYKIDLDDDGNVISIWYYVPSESGGWKESYEVNMTVDFKKCPDSIGVNGTEISAGGSTYQIYGNYGDEEKPGSDNGFISSMNPGEDLNTVNCGEITDIPQGIPKTTKIIYLLLQIGIPVALVVFSMIDLMKAVTAQKEDEIKKGQQTLVKKLISAALVFFVFAFVKLIVSFLADNTSVGKCLNCFIKGDCETSEPDADSNADV